jgi:NAD(P)-dependent dehydrogenase (short-subunit alcohol dehydrogenase family)
LKGKLESRVALITGGASGIGRASAILFAEEGANVVVVDIAPKGGKETVEMIRHKAGEAIFVEADVSKAADVKKMIGTALHKCGGIDVLFNNAGVVQSEPYPVGKTPEEVWDRTINVNLRSVFLCSKYAIPEMMKKGSGVIINQSSVNAIEAWRNFAAYCVSKAGVSMLTKVMAMEYGESNIRINCICPGAISTQLIASVSASGEKLALEMPLGRIGKPEDVANAALWLASDDSSWLTGTALVVDGGWTCGKYFRP